MTGVQLPGPSRSEAPSPAGLHDGVNSRRATGTTRAGRFGERVAHWVLKRLSARADVDAELVDLREHPLHRAVHILPDVIIAARQLADSCGTTAFAPLDPQLKALLDDLIWWAAALRTGRLSETARRAGQPIPLGVDPS